MQLELKSELGTTRLHAVCAKTYKSRVIPHICQVSVATSN